MSPVWTDRAHLLEMNKCMTSICQSTLPDLSIGGALQLEIVQYLLAISWGVPGQVLVLRELTKL